MHDTFYLLTGLALLAFLEKPARKIPLHARGILKTMVLRGLGLFWTVAALLVLYFAAVEIWIQPAARQEFLALFFMPAAYGAAGLLKKSAPFFLTVFAFCFLAMALCPAGPVWIRLGIAAGLALGWTVFQVLMLGLAEKIRLAWIPEAVQGFPVLLLIAALTALAFSGFYKM